jgi:hypothetical protein
MIRTIYSLLIVGLIGGTAWAAGGMDGDRAKLGPGMGIVIIAALQR